MSDLIADVRGGPCAGSYNVKRATARMIFTVGAGGKTYALDDDDDRIEPGERAFLYEHDPELGVAFVCAGRKSTRHVTYRFVGNVDAQTGEVDELDPRLVQRIRDEGRARVLAWARDEVERRWATESEPAGPLEPVTELVQPDVALTFDFDAAGALDVANVVVGSPPRPAGAPLPQSEIDELAFEVDEHRLEVGVRYRAIGPNVGKMAPAPELEVVGIVRDADGAGVGYRTKGLRQSAPFIAFGCERFWLPILELEGVSA